jgi:hypothetical protein
MSIKLLAAELSRFLGSTEPEVLCITGKWGVGKTYAWNHYLRQAQNDDKVKLEKYAYVSLFGRNSLDDVRTAIVENTVDGRAAGKKPDLTSFKSAVAELRSVAGPFAKLVSFVPSATSYVGSLNRALFLMVRNQIVCIDDLERVGSGLDTMNILGLVSSLKEEKSCKVVILLNQDALSGLNKQDFETQLEKTADTIIIFDPTPTEAAEIGIDKTTKFHSWLAEYTQALGIVNIRVIKKIETFCRRVHDIVADNDERILKQAVHTLALAAYAKFQPDDAPPLQFIKTYNNVSDLVDRKKDRAEDQNSRYRALLRSYGFQHIDEFDAPLIEGVERGFFDDAAVKRQANEFQETLKLGDKATAFEQVWRFFHDSLDDNEDAVLDAMVESTKANVVAISPVTLSGTVGFLKEFRRVEQARELVQFYTDNRQEEPKFWDLSEPLLLGHVTDPDVRAAFERKFTAAAIPPDPEEILKRLGGRSGWNQEDLERLASLTEADYIPIFKRLRGVELRRAVTGALVFREISNADERMNSITRTAEGALRQIAMENPMNAKRVRNFGVRIEEPDGGERRAEPPARE